MKTLDAYIAEQLFAQGLDRRYIDLIAGCATNVKFEADQYLFHEGEKATHFYIITHGHVALDMPVPGQGSVTIQTVTDDDVLGWSWLFPPYTWHFDARAVELTRAIAFDAVCLRNKCEADHDLGYEMMKRFSRIMVDRLQATRLQLMDVYGTGARR